MIQTHIVDCNHAPRSQKLQAQFIIFLVALFVGIDEGEVKCATVTILDKGLQGIRGGGHTKLNLFANTGLFPGGVAKFAVIFVSDIESVNLSLRRQHLGDTQSTEPGENA